MPIHFLNVDSFNSEKLIELKSIEKNPHIIALAEIKPKRYLIENELSESGQLSDVDVKP